MAHYVKHVAFKQTLGTIYSSIYSHDIVIITKKVIFYPSYIFIFKLLNHSKFYIKIFAGHNTQNVIHLISNVFLV